MDKNHPDYEIMYRTVACKDGRHNMCSSKGRSGMSDVFSLCNCECHDKEK